MFANTANNKMFIFGNKEERLFLESRRFFLEISDSEKNLGNIINNCLEMCSMSQSVETEVVQSLHNKRNGKQNQ